MRIALEQAKMAAERGEVPVGAVLLDAQGCLMSQSHNAREQCQDPTAHAEIRALRAAARMRGNWRLTGTTLVVTLEPCTMCAGALVLARVKRLVFGTTDPKAGAVSSLYRIPLDERLNHRVEVVSGVHADAAKELLQQFFQQRREESREHR